MPGDHTLQQGDDAIDALSDDSPDGSSAAASLRRHQCAAEVLEGTRAMDWSDWALAIPESQTLTAEGRRVAGWAVETLRHTLQEDFLSRAQVAAAQGTQGAHPIFWLNLWPMNDVPWVYANLFQLATQFHLFGAGHASMHAPTRSPTHAPNRFGQVAKSLRTNLQPITWVGGVLQLEIASLGLRAGWEVSFEPDLGQRRRADVALRHDDTTLLVETTSMKRSDAEQRALSTLHGISFRLAQIEATYNVRMGGVFGASQVPEELDAWMLAIDQAAHATLQDGIPRQVEGPGGGSLRVYATASDDTPDTLEITGPLVEARPVDRLVARLQDKNRQAEFSAMPVWVRLDEYAGLWEATRLQGQPLEDLLTELAPVVQRPLAMFSHLAGVVVAPATLWNTDPTGATLPVRSEEQGCLAVRCPLPGNRLRETLIIPRPGSVGAAQDARRFAEWYGQEETWLDWALQAAGLPPFAALVR